jgi:hypothetical protein
MRYFNDRISRFSSKKPYCSNVAVLPSIMSRQAVVPVLISAPPIRFLVVAVVAAPAPAVPEVAVADS